MNSNWTPWCKLSICKHFRTNRGTLEFIFEGDTDAIPGKDCFEIRIDGPDIKQSTEYTFSFAVNCLLSTVRDIKDVFKHERNLGYLQSIFPTGIPIYDNVGTVIECLRRNDDIVTVDYGYIKEGLQVKQSTVEAVYTAILRE